MSKKQRGPALPLEGVAHLCDAHTHITSCRDSVDDIVERAYRAGVTRMVTVGDGIDEAEAALSVAQQHEMVWAACAIHPTRAHELSYDTKKRLEEAVANPRCVSVGETGLDTYWIGKEEWCAPLDVQIEAFHYHIGLAVRSGKALMIHNREADEHIMRELGRALEPNAVILHCFSSPIDVAKQAIERGYVLSFAGNVTFKRNTELREIAAFTPAEQILIETDAPYMTPEPHRGARNEPAIIGHTARCVAEQRGESVESFLEQVQHNFSEVYGLA